MEEVLRTINSIANPWDILMIAVILMGAILYGLTIGREKIFITLISIYISLAVVTYIPYIYEFSARISVNDTFAVKVSVFLAFFILLFFFLSHTTLIKTIAPSRYSRPVWQNILFSILMAGLFLSVTLSFFPEDLSLFVSGITKKLFLSDFAKTIWVLLPIIAMTIFGNKRERY